jgi:hypothetical protein
MLVEFNNKTAHKHGASFDGWNLVELAFSHQVFVKPRVGGYNFNHLKAA